eukprot:scaffold81937_cov51-Attheya_sp.AAC.3
MGVRGLFSLLAQDPSRFGEPWVLSSSTATVIHIDGPALLFHLSSGKASPRLVYERTTCFLETLGSSAGRIHVVFDGVAHPAKRLSQIERMKKVAVQCDDDMQQRESKYRSSLVHPLSEAAMIEATQNLSHLNCHVHRAPHEAEQTIVQMILAGVDEDVIVLSNDSDFFVYALTIKERRVGWVPLDTVRSSMPEEDEPDAAIVVTGWKYTWTRFQSAFFPNLQLSDSNHRDWIMTLVAAVASCDYTTTDACPVEYIVALHRARDVMIKSTVGGLRPKHQVNPTASNCVLAALRYLNQFTTTKQQTSWRENILSSLVQQKSTASIKKKRKSKSTSISKDGKAKMKKEQDKCLMAAWKWIHEIYCPPQLGGTWLSVENVDLQRLLEQRVLYCRPVLETWKFSPRNHSKASPTSVKKKQKPLHGACSTAADRSYRKKQQSIWQQSPFSSVRHRLYTALWLGTNQLKQEEELFVVEVGRSGTRESGGVDFLSHTLPVPLTTANDEMDQSLMLGQHQQHDEETDCHPSLISFLEYCLLDHTNVSSSTTFLELFDSSVVDSKKGAHQQSILLESLLLEPRDVMILILLASAPSKLSSSIHKSRRNTGSSSVIIPWLEMEEDSISSFPNTQDWFQCQSRLTVACLHVRLVLAAAKHMFGGNGHAGTSHVNQIFRNDLVAHLIWNALLEEHGDCSDDVDLPPNLDPIFERMRKLYFTSISTTSKSATSSNSSSIISIEVEDLINEWQGAAHGLWNKHTSLLRN